MNSLGNVSKFQLILMGVFAAFIVVGVIVFAMGRIGPGSDNLEVSRAVVWGTVNSSDFRGLLRNSGLADNESFDITYVQKSEANFERDLLEALASQRGPDLMIISGDAIERQKARIFKIPFESYPEGDFKSTFLPVGEVYLIGSEREIVGLPFMVDPLVMYWNRDIFTNAAILEPPRLWSQLYGLSENLTQRSGSIGLSRSAVALGEFRNVTNAREILSALIIQAGNPITVRSGSEIQSVLNQSLGHSVVPAVSALSFYTEFSDPLKPFYSWNRSLPSSRDMFESGDLAVYFGFASELPQIQTNNPNLNFDVAIIPQTDSSSQTITYGRTKALALVQGSRNLGGALRVARALTSRESIQALTEITGLPPVRRDLASATPSTASDSVFYRSAIHSKSWVNPGIDAVDTIFLNMVESITGGRESVSGAVNRAHSELRLELSSN